MNIEKGTKNKLNTPKQDSVEPVKKPYSQPKLEIYGRLDNITLGVSPGVGESGGGFPTRPN